MNRVICICLLFFFQEKTSNSLTKDVQSYTFLLLSIHFRAHAVLSSIETVLLKIMYIARKVLNFFFKKVLQIVQAQNYLFAV